VLGHSSSAVVEQVRCRRIMLARKRIRCNYQLKREDAIEEVAHLQRLSHTHIVRAVGTYVQGNYLSILLYPATSYNLETFLELYDELKSNPSSDGLQEYNARRSIIKFVRCLSNTVAFLHEHLVKHMDIKPMNILVQGNEYAGFFRVYLADFGIAKSYKTAADAETESRTPFSRAYASPEVTRQDVRGFSADIFSLGCVLLEMLSAVTNRKEVLFEARHASPEGDSSFQANLERFEDRGLFNNNYVETGGPVWLFDNTKLFSVPGAYVGLLEQMMRCNPQKRPTAAELTSAFGKDDWCCSEGSQPFEAELPPMPTLEEAVDEHTPGAQPI
jgi:serine/threonine protein kinase